MQGENRIGGFIDVRARVPHIRRPEGQQSFPQGSAPGVHQADLALREFGGKMLRRYLRSGEGAADAGGHADEQHVVSRRQHGGHLVDIRLGRNLGGSAARTGTNGVVKCLSVKFGGVFAEMRLAVHIKMEGNYVNIALLEHGSVQVGGSIG